MVIIAVIVSLTSGCLHQKENATQNHNDLNTGKVEIKTVYEPSIKGSSILVKKFVVSVGKQPLADEDWARISETVDFDDVTTVVIREAVPSEYVVDCLQHFGDARWIGLTSENVDLTVVSELSTLRNLDNLIIYGEPIEREVFKSLIGGVYALDIEFHSTPDGYGANTCEDYRIVRETCYRS